MNRLFALASVALLPTILHAQDKTQTFETTPNFPLNAPMPVITTALPGNGLALTSGATNAFSLRLGSGLGQRNIVDGQAIRNTFYMNYLVGDLSQTIGAPMDTGQGSNSPFAAVARHYSVGDPNDLHVMTPFGMQLRAICSANHTNCSPGHVYGGMVRVNYEFRPGMTIKVRYKSPAGPYSWCPIWLVSGSEISPGPGGNPWQNFNTPFSLIQEPVYQHMFEIDVNDNYGRLNGTPSIPIGKQLDYGTPNIYGVQWTVAPTLVFGANQHGYSNDAVNQVGIESLPNNWSTDFHNLVMSWDGSTNMIYGFVDGKLVVSSYMEYAQAPIYFDGFSNTVKVQAMHLIIGNQAIPQWLAGSGSTTENDGIPNGWTITVQEISAWNGTVTNPTAREP